MEKLNLYRSTGAMTLVCLISLNVSSQILTCADIGGTGDLNTRCTISNMSVMISDGDIISGTGTLELDNHGELYLDPGNSFIINMGGDLLLLNGGRIYGNVDITCANLYVDGAINATGKGYESSEGPGAGADGIDSIQGGAGAAYGGNGGIGQNTINTGGSAYGFSVTQPFEMGSGGGEQQFWFTAGGGKGGGTIKINASGMVTINGTIGSNGDVGFCMGPNYCSGGGSGGSVWIQADNITGTGSITANGGNGGIGVFAGGGGGGGRVALYYATSSFTGSITAAAGVGINSEHGGAGTVYQNNGTSASLTINNKMFPGALTPFDMSITQTFDNFTIGDSARVHLYGASNTTIGNFTIASTGSVISPTNPERLNMSVNNFTIETGGVLDYSGNGYGSAEGPGMGGSVTSFTQGAGGGAYAADGGDGDNGGGSGGTGGYGSEYQPINFGSGGGNINMADTLLGGFGGGAIWLNVAQVLHVDGMISVNGTNGADSAGAGAGGGSGGSVVLCAETISGSGTISADGGAGGNGIYPGGGGSGGRLAIFANTISFTGGTTSMGGLGLATNSGTDGSIVNETDCGSPPPINIDIEEPEIIAYDEFKVYPNPNTGSFNVSMYLYEKRDVTLRVINLVGQVVYIEEFTQIEGTNIKPMILEQEPGGIYYLSIITDKVVFNKKIVLQR